jgi:phage recombination protein Bet
MSKEIAKVSDSFELVTKEEVRKHFCESATEKEVALFLQIAKLNQLNPFKREIYIVKYGDAPASILTGYEVYLKRAERSGNYAGFKVWVEGSIKNGDLKACIEVRRKDWPEPLQHEVYYNEYVGKKKDGTPTRFWKEKPITMLKKVVISQAFRFAFPDELGGMPYTADEINTIDNEVVSTSTREVDISMPKALPVKENKPEVKEEPQEVADYDSPPAQEELDAIEPPQYISEKQRKRLYALCKKQKLSDQDMKDYLRITHGIKHSTQIPKDKYRAICTWVDPDSENK